MMTFKRSTFFSLLVAAIGLLFTPAAFADKDVDFLKNLNNQVKNVNKKVTPATIAIISPVGSTGSGVIVSSDGLILTAAHVIQGADDVTIVFPDGQMKPATVLGANYTRDAAMVKLKDKGPWPHVKIGDPAALSVGDYVVAMGHSKGYDPNRRPPIRFGRIIADAKQRFMMTECTLIGGDSGGPLFNLNGEVVGIHSSIGPNVSINNHIPLSAFKTDWDRLLNGDHWGQLGLNIMEDREAPILGFTMLDTRRNIGVVVGVVLKDSPAHKAGLTKGDIITHMAERPVESPRAFVRELERYKPDDTVELIVVRNGQTYKTPVTFGRRSNVRILER